MTRFSTLLILLHSVFLCMTASTKASAATLLVPSEYAAIQAAIDSATDGDEIVVATGTYYETIHFQGKNIRLASTNPRDWAVVEATIIDASQMGSVVTFAGSETAECVLAGFTIRNGSAPVGGGIQGNGCGATLEWNLVTENRAYFVFGEGTDYKGVGGGVYDADGVIRNCRIERNRSEDHGTGLIYCDGLIQNNLIAHNEIGVAVKFCDGLLLNNTIVENGDGIEDCRGLIANCIVESIVESTLPIHSCIIDNFGCWGCFRQGGTDPDEVEVGNIRGNPMFVDEVNGDYRLASTSPCIDSGNPFYVVGDFIVDLDGNSRSWDASVDMGCYEFASLYDTDGDLLTDAQEEVHGTDLNDPDTDGDGLIDGIEFFRGTDPLVSDSPTGLVVPDDYPFISLAVYFAFPTEEIVVRPGTYTENILISRDVVLRSEDPLDSEIVASTILDGSRTGSVVTFLGNESQECRVTGLTLTRGSHARGGGINGNGTHATIENNRILRNFAYQLEPTHGYGGQGGGVHGVKGTISGNVIAENRAHYGCGLAYCDGEILENRIERNETLPFHFYGNFPAGIGGGLYRCGGPIIGNEIVDNIAGGHGGGLAHCSGLILDNRIVGNRGGPSRFYVIGEEITLSEGGGLFNCDGEIVSNEIRMNLAANGGGLADCDGLITDNEIVSNTAEEGRGGGLVECDATIVNNRFIANTAGAGGAAYRCNGDFSENLFFGNQAEAHIEGTIALSSTGGWGGALGDCTGRFERNIFIANRAIGKFYISYGIPIGIPVSGGAYGGAVFNCQGNLVNNLFVENEAIRPVGGIRMETIGGAIHNFDGLIAHNTLVGNRAPDMGGAVSNSPATIQNCIFWLNSASEEAQIFNSTLPDHCLIQDWTGGGIGNIDLDPKFVDPENGDFHLRNDSPCIDSGVLIASVTEDLDGNTRPFLWSTQYGGDGSGYDMGAYEFYPGPDVNYDHSIDGLDLFVFQQDWRSISGPSEGGASAMGTDLSTSLSIWKAVTGPGSYTPSGYATDLDADGKVDVYDLLNLLNLMK